MTGITMATRDLTLLDHCLPSCSEGMQIYTYTSWLILYVYACVQTRERAKPSNKIFSLFRLFRNLTKEVSLYAQKFVDRGKVSSF